MNAVGTLAATHPVLFALGLTCVCFILVLFATGIATVKLRKPYSDVAAVLIRLVVTAGLLVLMGRLGGLEGSGIAHPGRWQAWLLAVGGVLYMTGAGLYAFYGKVVLDSVSLRSPAARTLVLRQLVEVLHEEILYRGAVLYVLTNAWGDTGTGKIGSVILTAVLFAIPHLVALFMGLSLPAALLLIVQGCIIAVWWGALVLWGGSIWPAVLLHYGVNIAVALQGLTVPMIRPDTRAYRRILWFSLPLGALGIGLLA